MAATIFCLRVPRERRRRGPARSRAKSEDDGGEPCQFGAGLSAPALTVERCRSVTTGPSGGSAPFPSSLWHERPVGAVGGARR